MDDIWPVIFAYCIEGSNYKKLTLVSNQWRQMAIKAHPDAKNIMSVSLMTIVKRNPTLDYDWYAISEIADWDYIKSNLNLPWNWYYVSKNKSITINTIITNPGN